MNMKIFITFFSLWYSIVHGGPGQAMNMDLAAGEEKCIGQELDQEDIAFFTMSSKPKHEANADTSVKAITASLQNPDDTIVFESSLVTSEPPLEKKQIIYDRGVYKLCFSTKGAKHSDNIFRVSFSIDYRNRGADPSKKVGKDEIPSLESQLKAAEDSLSEIVKEIDFARRQEVLLRTAGETTSSRIEWFGYLSIIVLIVVSLWQILYLRNFFASKKLL